MRQAIVAVEVLSLVAECIDFSDQVAFVVVAGFPGAAVWVGHGRDKCCQVVIAVGDAGRTARFA